MKNKSVNITNTKNVTRNETNEKFFSGLTGEAIALKELQSKGFELVRARYKNQFGEIDLIVEDAKRQILVFVEVKRRKNIYDYSGVITSKQWQRIHNSSSVFLDENKDKYKNYTIRYDAFICFTNSNNSIHIENIFYNDY